MNIVEKAIKNNEIKFLLEGTNGYKLENDSWASISAPIDWTRVVPLIYLTLTQKTPSDYVTIFLVT